MARTYKVEYIGNKPFSMDNVAKSGKSWAGKGDIQEVTAAQAKILISYTDQWALAEGESTEGLDAPIVVETKDDKGDTVETNADELTIPVEKMTATQLAAYAKLKYNKDLNIKRGRKILLDEVNVLDGNISVD